MLPSCNVLNFSQFQLCYLSESVMNFQGNMVCIPYSKTIPHQTKNNDVASATTRMISAYLKCQLCLNPYSTETRFPYNHSHYETGPMHHTETPNQCLQYINKHCLLFVNKLFFSSIMFLNYGIKKSQHRRESFPSFNKCESVGRVILNSMMKSRE